MPRETGGHVEQIAPETGYTRFPALFRHGIIFPLLRRRHDHAGEGTASRDPLQQERSIGLPSSGRNTFPGSREDVIRA
nr:hypothetical protein [Azospirillum brasilense]